MKGEQGEIIALAAQAGSKGKGHGDSRDKNTVCTHCKKVVHEAVDCFQLVGYPDRWGDRPRDVKTAGRSRGSTSGDRGRTGAVRANVAQAAATV